MYINWDEMRDGGCDCYPVSLFPALKAKLFLGCGLSFKLACNIELSVMNKKYKVYTSIYICTNLCHYKQKKS